MPVHEIVAKTPEQETDIRGRTITGILWSIFGQVGQQGIRFIVILILARLLMPKEFGLVGMIEVFTGFAAMFGEMGFGAAIIQKQDVEERLLSSVFWLSIVMGVLLTSILAACAPLIAAFYNQRILLPLTLLLSLNFAINSLNIIQNSLLTKKMDFRRLAIINITAITTAGIVAVAMALAGFGVWSLAINTLLTTTFSVILMWSLSGWRPRLIFEWKDVKELIDFSMNLMGSRISTYWTANADNLLIGKYVSATALGVYDRAFSLMVLPRAHISAVLARVMFPALSAIQADKKKVKQVFLRANRAIALITFPMMMGLLMVAKPFILTIYGEKWMAVVPILQIFCLEGMGRSVGTTVGWIYLSQARTDIMFKWGLFSGVVRVASIIIGLQWGVVGVAIAIVLSGYTILWYPSWVIPGRLINLSFWEVMKNLGGPFWCSVVMAAAVFAFGIILPSDWPEWTRLATQVPLGVVVYVLLIHVFQVRAYREVRELAVEQYRKLRPPVPVEAGTPL
jgi:O-antigen/teichoic acid export membrane protein